MRRPRRLAGALGLVGAALAISACAGGQEPEDDADAESPTTSEVGSPAPTSPSAAEQSTEATTDVSVDPDELGEFDRELVLQLREIGVADAYPGEYGFRGSVVGGHDEDGNRIQVSTNEQDVVGDSEFVRSGEISGVPVEYRRFGSAVDTLMFRCAGTHYDVRKYDGPESGRVDLEATEALVQRLITSIGCS